MHAPASSSSLSFRQKFSNVSSETARSIGAKFYVERPTLSSSSSSSLSFRQKFSNVSSETARSIGAKFYVEPPLKGERTFMI